MWTTSVASLFNILFQTCLLAFPRKFLDPITRSHTIPTCCLTVCNIREWGDCKNNKEQILENTLTIWKNHSLVWISVFPVLTWKTWWSFKLTMTHPSPELQWTNRDTREKSSQILTHVKDKRNERQNEPPDDTVFDSALKIPGNDREFRPWVA